MFVGTEDFICSRVELVHKMWRLQFHRLLQFVSGGCQVCFGNERGVIWTSSAL
jgi:hypothetical protein